MKKINKTERLKRGLRKRLKNVGKLYMCVCGTEPERKRKKKRYRKWKMGGKMKREITKRTKNNEQGKKEREKR